MTEPEPKYLLIVKVPRGLNVWDRPAAQSAGALKRRAERAGAELLAYDIYNVQGVPYARLVPQDPKRPEYVRVSEADGSIDYVEIIELRASPSQPDFNQIFIGLSGIASALNRIADALKIMGK